MSFCFSDKCLNQYKMNIFCKETQAHLQLHASLAGGADATPGDAASGGSGALITPELWLRDCRGGDSDDPAGVGSVSPRSSVSSPGITECSPPVSPSPPQKPPSVQPASPIPLRPKSQVQMFNWAYRDIQRGFKQKRVISFTLK
jgi:hypothetical protein